MFGFWQPAPELGCDANLHEFFQLIYKLCFTKKAELAFVNTILDSIRLQARA